MSSKEIMVVLSEILKDEFVDELITNELKCNQIILPLPE